MIATTLLTLTLCLNHTCHNVTMEFPDQAACSETGQSISKRLHANHQPDSWHLLGWTCGPVKEDSI